MMKLFTWECGDDSVGSDVADFVKLISQTMVRVKRTKLFADSRAHTPCTAIERKALSVIAQYVIVSTPICLG